MTDRGDHTPPTTGTLAGTTLRRRGMLAAVAALAAGGLAKSTATPALAGTDGDLVLNTSNTATATTILTGTINNPFELLSLRNDGSGWGLHVVNNTTTTNAQPAIEAFAADIVAPAPAGTTAGIGVVGRGGRGLTSNTNGAAGVSGFGGGGTAPGTNGVGVQGTGGGSSGTSAPGVIGIASLTTPNAGAVIGQNLAAGDGVTGLSTGTGNGVHGVNGTGVGVRGDSQQAQGVIGTSGQNNGVYGLAGSGGNGVFGQSGTGTGVYGQSTSGNAIFGTSSSAAGVYGQTATNNGVVGEATGSGNGVVAKSATGNALYAQATGAGNAAAFFGPVQCFGNFTVMPGFVKNGAVRFNDGSVRQLYATEAPENWFEDFGEATLVNGRVSVPIPADFLQAVNTSVPYHVFTESHTTDVEALAVTVRAPDHFEVEANGKGQVTGSFSYRIVVKRKDVVAPRFAPVTGHETAQAGQALDAKPSTAIPVNLPPAVAQDAAPNPWLPTTFPPPTPALPKDKPRQ
jgi:hypothetical protein